MVSQRPIRFCGVDCNHCKTYQEFLAGDESVIVNPESNYRCCWLPKNYPKGMDCPIRICCEEKGIVLCGECSQFAECVRMKEFYAQPGYDELRRRMLEETGQRRREYEQRLKELNGAQAV